MKLALSSIILFIILLFIILLLAAVSVFAETGCYLDPNSDGYCTELELTVAQEECHLNDDCEISTVFANDQACSNFDECEVILCKSSCEQEFAGLCTSGPVPTNQADLWCQSEGCCRFYNSGTNPFCQIEDNKWLCHIAATNVESENLDWDQSINKISCKETCLATNYPYQAKLESSEIEYYKDSFILTNPNQESNSNSQEIEAENIKYDSEQQTISQKLTKILAPIFLLFILSLLAIFFYEHRHTIIKDYRIIEKKIKNKSRSKKSSSSTFSKSNIQNAPSSKSKKFIEELAKISLTPPHKLHHQHIAKKMHAKLELTESFSSYQVAQIPKNSTMKKLAKIANKYHRKLQRKKRNRSKLENLKN
jgi:hypothetical protein